MALSQEQYDQLDEQGKLMADILKATKAGDYKKADLLRQRVIIPAEALMALKRARGPQAIIDRKLRTETAEAKYGKDWLNR